jgi:hypothetical protein
MHCFVPIICNFAEEHLEVTMKQLLYICAVAMLLLAGCGEKKSPLDAEARDSGMRAAAALVSVDHTDTMSMERAVMDAKAKQSVYALKRDSAAVRAFDEAFRSYLKEKDRPLYNTIFPDEK